MTQQFVELVNHKKLLVPQLVVGDSRGMTKVPKSAAREAFARALQMARRRKHASAAAMARALGVEEETYRRYERAETEPSIAELGRMAQELDVSTDFLVLGDIPPPKTKRK